MDVHQYVREQEQPELPSESMRETFELWDTEYTVEALTNLSSSQLDAKKADFEGEVQVLLAEHRPGRLIANRPALASASGKPPYTAAEWRRAREMIRTEAKKIRFRFDQAAGKVAEHETDAKRTWIAELVEALPTPVSIRL
ncbi:hypothetical protein [Halobellus ordinarius]|uniref:hypothetical protein n=1 Tax=Halobellus ordinarius TaxID=3075120 RepID=UPI002880762E|nr:hypothetical protein [Halobellus sp. ZY16]